MKNTEGIDEIWEEELKKIEILKFCKSGMIVLLLITIFLIINL